LTASPKGTPKELQNPLPRQCPRPNFRARTWTRAWTGGDRKFLFGFCQREKSETSGILTFVYAEREGVDRIYERFRSEALDAPRENPRYPIYNFFARDPEGRMIEFQMFTGEVDLP